MADINKLLSGGGAGGVDTSMYSGAVPDVNPLAIITGLQQQDNLATQNQLQQIELRHAQANGLKSLAGPLAANPNATHDDYVNAIASGLRLGYGTPQQASDLIQQIPDDPAQRNAFGKQLLLQMQSAHDAFSNAVGTPTPVNRGGSTDFVNVNPYNNTVTGMGGNAASIRNTLSPGQKTDTVATVDPATGAGRTIPKGQAFDDQGNLKTIPVYRNGQPAAAAPATQPVPDPSAPAVGGAGPQASSGPAPSAPATPAGFQTSLGAAQQGDIASSAKQFQDDRADIAPSRDRVFGLVSALDAVRGTNVGPGTATRQKILSAINALPASLGKGIVPDGSDLSDYDVGRKYFAAAMLARQGAGRSDAAQNASAAASPNMDSMSKDAVIDVAHSMIGQERMRQARTINAINSKTDPGQYANSIATSQATDPKAFALGVMTPQERDAYYSGLSGPAKAKFMASVRLGVNTGVLSRDDLMGATSGQ